MEADGDAPLWRGLRFNASHGLGLRPVLDGGGGVSAVSMCTRRLVCSLSLSLSVRAWRLDEVREVKGRIEPFFPWASFDFFPRRDVRASEPKK